MDMHYCEEMALDEKSNAIWQWITSMVGTIMLLWMLFSLGAFFWIVLMRIVQGGM